jgi:hypothetical protein
MKQVLLASILAAAVASVATFLLTEALRPPAAPSSPAPDPGVAALRASLEETRRELAALRASPPTMRDGVVLAGAAPGQPRTSVTAPEPGGAPGAEPAEGVVFKVIPPEEVAAGPDEPVRRDEPSAITRAADVVQKLRGFSDWEDNADVRSRWILTPEDSVVREFGKPDEIYVQDSGVECWLYRVPMGTTDEDGNAEWDDVTLTLNRGRLVRVDD